MIKHISREPSNSFLELEQDCKDYFWKASRDIPSPFVLKQSKYFCDNTTEALAPGKRAGEELPIIGAVSHQANS